MRGFFPRSAAILILCFTAAAGAANAGDVPYFWPPAVHVAIFKDGSAFVIREGEAEPGPQGVLTERVPRPTLGTLDVYSLTDGVRVAEVTAYHDEAARKVPVSDLGAFYRLLVGRRITVTCEGQETKGVLRGVLDPHHLLVETEGRALLIPLAEVERLGLDGPAPLETDGSLREPRFRIRLSGAAPRRVRLGLSYLTANWAWSPSYRINLRPDGQAELILTAVVVNDAEDVDGATLHLVVGVPNFLMRGTLSPMALDVDAGRLAQVSSLQQKVQSQVFDNAMRNYVLAEAAPAPGAGEAAPLGSVEDLFIYEKKGFTLGRGQRMQFELFRGLVPYQSIYKWEIPLSEAEKFYGQRGSQMQGKFAGEQTGSVWHHLRLTNKTAVPWTTAPATIVSGWQPLAQDLLKFVPVGGVQDLRVTVAPEIKGLVKEEEIARQNVRLFNNDAYLQITVRGTVTLENAKKVGVRMEIAKDIWGDPVEAPGAEIMKSAEFLWNVNPRAKLSWRLDLPAGGKKTLAYTYVFYLNI